MELQIGAFVTPVLTAIGALIAAWLGTHLGLRKFRRERAFDARLKWHVELAETARILLNRMRSLNTFRRGGTPPEVAMPLVQDLGRLAFSFQEKAELASLYATKSTYNAISETLNRMAQDALPFATYPADESAVSPEERTRVELGSLSGVERVYDLLARDTRELLDLEKLDEHRTLPGSSR